MKTYRGPDVLGIVSVVVLIALICCVICFVIGGTLGVDTGIKQERLLAIEANVGEWTINKSTGEKTFVYGKIPLNQK